MDKEPDQQQKLDIAAEFPPNRWEEWKQAVEESLKGVPFDKAMITKTYEGIDLQPIYRREDINGLPHLNSLPGQPPFVRGNTAAGFNLNGWVIAQRIKVWNPAEANKILLDELNRGLSAVNLKLDRFTRWATIPPFDSLNPDGLWLNDLEDISALLDKVDLSAVPIFIDGGEASIVILGLLAAYCKKNGINYSALHGCVGFDLTAALAEDSELPFCEEDKWLTLYQMADWAATHAPGLRTVILDGTFWGNRGADSLSELAYVIAAANEYINALLEMGLSLKQIVPRFQINLTLGSNLFMEIAKVRAARLLWAELMQVYKAPEEMQKVWIHGVTSEFNKTQYDPYVNILRTSTESFSGVIGGVDSLEVVPFDVRIRPDDEFSRRISRNQQIILQEEAHLNKVTDPAGGCYYVENLTYQLAEKAWSKLQSIEADGGFYQAVKTGRIQSETAQKASEKKLNAEKRKDVYVGVNMFANPLEQPLDNTDANCMCGLLAHYEQKVAAEDATRPGLEQALQELTANCKDIKVVEYLMEAILAGATLEEAFDCIVPPEGNLQAPVLPISYITEGLENLRTRVVDYQQTNQTVLSVFLANMGPISQHKARADFAQGFLQVGGFYVESNDGFDTVDKAAAAAINSQAGAVCICSTDDTYPELVPQLISTIRKQKQDMIFILAGYPQDMVETYKQQGIDIFIHIRANALDTLTELANRMGVQS